MANLLCALVWHFSHTFLATILIVYLWYSFNVCPRCAFASNIAALHARTLHGRTIDFPCGGRMSRVHLLHTCASHTYARRAHDSFSFAESSGSRVRTIQKTKEREREREKGREISHDSFALRLCREGEFCGSNLIRSIRVGRQVTKRIGRSSSSGGRFRGRAF